MRYEMGGIIFDPDIGPDANGFEWVIANLDGWDAPELRQSLLDTTGIHGQVMGESLYGSRPMTAEGWIGVPNDAGFWAARNVLSNATNAVTTPMTLIVREAVPKKCQVYRAGKLRMRNHEDVYVVEFEIPLVALDPRKYALNDTVVSLP